MKEIQLTKGAFTIVDNDKYLDLIKCRWCLNGEYAYNFTHGSLHRYLMNLPINKGQRGSVKDQIQVDHINGNKLDNRLENLRLANLSENQLNHSQTKGKSKYRGVIWAGKQKSLINAGKPWAARLKPTGKPRIYLGSFATEEEAALAYNNAVLNHSEKFGKLNTIGI